MKPSNSNIFLLLGIGITLFLALVQSWELQPHTCHFESSSPYWYIFNKRRNSCLLVLKDIILHINSFVFSLVLDIDVSLLMLICPNFSVSLLSFPQRSCFELWSRNVFMSYFFIFWSLQHVLGGLWNLDSRCPAFYALRLCSLKVIRISWAKQKVLVI